MAEIFTIGHSNHPLERFLELLRLHRIEAICDVRSSPYSRRNPQFNRENLMQSLRDHNIAYVFLGPELGARSEDPGCYVNGKVQYDRLAKTDLFRCGLERVQEGAANYRIALMCAEKDPLDCHRGVLISRHIEVLGLPVRHILADGGLEWHSELLVRMRKKLHLPENDLFRSPEEVMEDAYRMQGERIAYQTDEMAGSTSD